MKYILIVLALLCAKVHADNYVRVKGIGKSVEEAKTNAFRSAVQYRVGMVLLSDREARNNELTKNEIATYSSGYVDNFRIIQQRTENNLVTLIVDVLVSDSKISQRLLSNSKSVQQFEGGRHAEQISTLMYEKQSGDKLLKQVLNDYPLRAYDIKQLPYQLKFDSHRNLQLFVPYQIKWNDNFLKAFKELLDNLQEGVGDLSQYPGNIFLVTNEGYVENRRQYKFNDLVKVEAIRRHIKEENEVRLRLVIRNGNGDIVGTKCYYPDFVVGKHRPMYSLGNPNTVFIWQSEVENNHVQFNFNYQGDVPRLAFFINRIELEVSRDKECGHN